MNAERLLKLADHLEAGQLGHTLFDFAYISRGDRQENGCGTNGCALGEMPMVFPDLVRWARANEWDSSMRYSGFDGSRFEEGVLGDDPFEIAEDLFDITKEESGILFAPSSEATDYNDEGDEESQNPADYFGGEFLTTAATKQQVASNIRKFVAYKQREAREV